MRRRFLSLAASVALAAGMTTVVTAPLAAASPPATPASWSRSLPAVYPTPQSMRAAGPDVVLPGRVALVVGAHSDPDAVSALRSLLASARVRHVDTTTDPARLPRTEPAIFVGGPGVTRGSAQALAAAHVADAASLPAEGYVLATARVAGRPDVVLDGHDGAGTFYAVQTLRQLTDRDGHQGRVIPGVAVRDWPTISVRGTIEGFYGPSWTDAQIASQLRFYGATKMNTFVYSAKNDPFLRDRWQDLYPPAQLAALGTLATTAQSEHVNFVYALSPGLSICYSDPTDLQQLEAKDQQLWNVGVRQFALFFDDIGSGLHCSADETKFAGSPNPQAAAQAYLMNEFVADFIDTHSGAQPLITVPTDYAGIANSPYRQVWASSLDPSVLVYWTGVGVIPKTITASQAREVAGEFGHKILVWDNYPVNDYDPTRLFLGPLVGRAADLGTAVAGFTSNPMQEPAPSTIPEFTTADYTWNPTAYAADPDAAWHAGIDSYGGRAGAALAVFAANNQSTPRIGTLPESPELSRLITAFWAADHAATGSRITPALRKAALALVRQWRSIADAPTTIETRLPEKDFVTQAQPWLTKMHYSGLAGATAVELVVAQKVGATGLATVLTHRLDGYYAKAAAVPDVVGQGVFEPFLLAADPALLRFDVRLYAADPADAAIAATAASQAGISADQVTRSFATAWRATSSGEYQVIAVGGPALNALYFNPCGWTAPNGIPGGSTPFGYVIAPTHGILGANLFQNGAGQTAADTAARVDALTYYAVRGTLPAGVTSPAPAIPATMECGGTPS